jgi:hypothetical protein
MMKKVIFIILILVAISEGCKKYEDGPCFSLRSVKNRIVGTWKVDKLYIDGIDSTEEYNTKLGFDLEFNKDSYNGKYFWKLSLKKDNIEYTQGMWEFPENEDKHQIRTVFLSENAYPNAIGPIGSIGINRDNQWTILRLTNKEFNLTTNSLDDYFAWGKPGGGTYLVELKKQ